MITQFPYLLANYYHSCFWCSRRCHRQHGRPSEKCRLFQNSDLTKFDICSQDKIDRRLKFIEKTLGHRAVPEAKYDWKEQKKREYQEDTRKGVLDEIGVWACTHSDTKNCWWVTGRPGVGKSTIGAKVASTFEDEKSLYAQYFVTRNIAATTHPENILPTLAQQLAENSPFAALAIEEKLKTTLPSIVKNFSDLQAKVLLLEPLRAIAPYYPKVVVVIDAVDELVDAPPLDLSKVTSVLCSIMSDLPDNVKILIFSRPEDPITAEIPCHIRRLDLATKNSEDGVDRLVRSKLRELAKFQGWNDWPSEHQVSLLCQVAAGHLGLAATALRWIASEIKSEGRARRDEVIEEVGELGTGEIDDLYAFILRSILPRNPVRIESYLKGLKTVLGCLVVLQKPLDIDCISTMLSLDRDKFDVLHCMKRISSLIVEGTESLTKTTVPNVHKSLVDYLVSNRSDPNLHIDVTEQHHSLTTTCFKSIQRLPFNVGCITSSHRYKDITISQGITYPCQWLRHHLENGGERATLVQDINNFMKTDFLRWLEVLSLEKVVKSVAISTLKVLEKQIKVSIHFLTKYGS